MKEGVIMIEGMKDAKKERRKGGIRGRLEARGNSRIILWFPSTASSLFAAGP